MKLLPVLAAVLAMTSPAPAADASGVRCSIITLPAGARRHVQPLVLGHARCTGVLFVPTGHGARMPCDVRGGPARHGCLDASAEPAAADLPRSAEPARGGAAPARRTRRRDLVRAGRGRRTRRRVRHRGDRGGDLPRRRRRDPVRADPPAERAGARSRCGAGTSAGLPGQEAAKDQISVPGMGTVAVFGVLLPTTHGIDVPVFNAVGTNDVLFCGVRDCSDADAYRAATRAWLSSKFGM